MLFVHCHPQCLQPCSRPPPTQATARDSWAHTSLGHSLVGSLLLSPGSWCAQDLVCALQESVSPVLCKFWQLYCGVNGDLLQEGVCHIQACCTQSPYPCSRPLLTRTSAGNTQTQFWLSPCGVSALPHFPTPVLGIHHVGLLHFLSSLFLDLGIS